jgi:hypothetical protein
VSDNDKHDGFVEHDVVKLIEDFEGIPAGSKGTIVHLYWGEGVFEVEFEGGDTRTISAKKVKK